MSPIIDDDVYDIGSAKFEDLKRDKIIHFDNLTTLYDESNARVRYFTPEEEPQLTQRTVLVDVDVDDDKRAVYFKQAKYGMFVRMALIMKLLGIKEVQNDLEEVAID